MAAVGRDERSSLVERHFRRIVCPTSMTSAPSRRPPRACGSSVPKKPKLPWKADPAGRPEEPPSPAPPSAPPEDVQPAARFPLPAADRLPGEDPGPSPPHLPTPAASRRRASRPGPMPLPHWTEPATGEVPMIADEPGDEEIWSAAGNEPRFRADVGNWGEADFSLGDESLSRRHHRDGRPGRHPRGRRGRGVRGAGRGGGPPPGRTRTEATAARAVPWCGCGCRSRAVAVPVHRRPGRNPRSATDRDDLPARMITGAILAAVALLRVRHRPGRHRGARHRDRRRGRVRAVRGLPPRRVPARHAARPARLAVAGRHRLQPRRAGVPAGQRGRRRLHAVLVPRQGRARAADGERRGHHLRVRLRRHPRWLRGSAARVPRRRRHDHRPRRSARWPTTSPATSSAPAWATAR